MEINQLLLHPLLEGVDPGKLQQLLTTLHSVEISYSTNSFLLHPGEITSRFGILVEGRIKILKEDFDGNATLITHIQPVDLFAEAFAWSEQRLTVSVQAAQHSRVIWLDCKQFVQHQDDPSVRQVQQNLLRMLAGKNVFLTGRIDHLSKRTLREKLLSYLWEEAWKTGSLEFSIPLNRQELADFLAADRSALSAVLSRLQNEGVLHYHKNHFKFMNRTSQSYFGFPANLDG